MCNIGLFGTKYVRDTPAPATFTLSQGTTQTLSIEQIRSQLTIGNLLDIHLRQSTGASMLDWVRFK